MLSRVFGEGIYALVEQASPPDVDGWVTLSLTFETLESARGILIGFGTLVEVLDPKELRESIADLAVRVATFYGK